MGNSRRIVKTIVRTPTRSLVCRYRCSTYITSVVSLRMQAMTKNMAPKYICQTRNMRWSVSNGRAIMTSSVTSSMTKSLQKKKNEYFISCVHDMRQFHELRTSLTLKLNLILNGLQSFRHGINSLITYFSMFRIYCNEIFMLYKVIASEFTTMACNNFFFVAVTPCCNDFVVIATIFSIVIVLFSCSVMCVNNVE